MSLRTACLLALIGGAAAAQGTALSPGATGARLAADGTLILPPPPVAAPAPASVSFDAAGLADDPAAAATVLADRITLSGERQLEAAGGVVVWYQGTRLIADRVLFDPTSDRITITGPIHLTRPATAGTAQEVTLVADAAQLDRKLRAGLLQGARLVLAREMQMAAREVRLGEGGRLTTLTHVVASSCQVCAAHPTPIWEIRARRITHDADARRLTFERPQFRAFGLPLAAIPATITAPAPGVERATGFLRPRLRSTSALGVGVRLPYFITLGDSADLTLTPYIASSRTLTLEARARQAFAGGSAQIEGAVSRDDLRDGSRGYVIGVAETALPGGFTLRGDLQWTSDRTYLRDYGHGDPDRLWSGLTLSRIAGREWLEARAGRYTTQRADEAQATMPTEVGEFAWHRSRDLAGGTLALDAQALALRRPSTADGAGRDVGRASFGLGWSREAVLSGGLTLRGEARVDADIWRVEGDSTLPATISRAVPTLAVDLRWPLQRVTGSAVDLLEPFATLVWSPDRPQDVVPVEDASAPVLDEGSLFARDRLPGRDLRAAGLRGTVGLTWTRVADSGDSYALTAARVIEDRSSAAYNADWLLAANFTGAAGLAAVGRVALDGDGGVRAAEAQLGVLRDDVRLSAGLVQIGGVRQLAFDGGAQVGEGWWLTASARHDLAARRTQTAALGVAWRTDCLTAEASVARDWGLPGSAPDTSFDLSVRLGGFGRDPEGVVPGTVARRGCLR